jgi:hypothetical protein
MTHESKADEQKRVQEVAKISQYVVRTAASLQVVCTFRQTKKQVGPVVVRSFFVSRGSDRDGSGTPTIWLASSHVDGAGNRLSLIGRMSQHSRPLACWRPPAAHHNSHVQKCAQTPDQRRTISLYLLTIAWTAQAGADCAHMGVDCAHAGFDCAVHTGVDCPTRVDCAQPPL